MAKTGSQYCSTKSKSNKLNAAYLRVKVLAGTTGQPLFSVILSKSVYIMFHKNSPFDFLLYLSQIVDNFYKNFQCVHKEVFFLMQLKIQCIFLADIYLISGLNRIENTVQYSINNQAGVLH